MKDTISVIIPIYNCEKYLDQCLESVCNQKKQFDEIILVDDGSSDRSLEICMKYQTKHNHVKAFHKENGGNTSARKEGFRHASGDYILFIDSDDWIELETCDWLHTQIENTRADMITFAHVREQKINRIVRNNIPEGLYCSDNEKAFLCENIFFTHDWEFGTDYAIWSKLIKKSILESFLFQMDDGIQFGEDTLMVCIAASRAERVLVTNQLLYHYRVHNNSVMRQDHFDYYENYNLLYIFARNQFRGHKFEKQLRAGLKKYVDWFIIKGINGKFADEREVAFPMHIFSAKELKGIHKIILYGAGEIGQSYYKYIRAHDLTEIVGWLDKNSNLYQGLNIGSIEEINEMQYDKILIALEDEDMVKAIQNELVDNYDVDESKILWIKPKKITQFYSLE